MPPAMEVQSPNHWTVREFPLGVFSVHTCPPTLYRLYHGAVSSERACTLSIPSCAWDGQYVGTILQGKVIIIIIITQKILLKVQLGAGRYNLGSLFRPQSEGPWKMGVFHH